MLSSVALTVENAMRAPTFTDRHINTCVCVCHKAAFATPHKTHTKAKPCHRTWPSPEVTPWSPAETHDWTRLSLPAHSDGFHCVHSRNIGQRERSSGGYCVTRGKRGDLMRRGGAAVRLSLIAVVGYCATG